jgi:Ca2+-binding RTX toxin-like protein
MGWYAQGTHVIDFVENPDGTVYFQEAGFFIPENANEWVSHVFDFDQNSDGTVTYFGATGDFVLGARGRNAIDVYKTTLPPPPLPLGSPGNPTGGPCAQPIRGTKGRDKLFGSIGNDDIRGRRGKDRIKARAGDDCVNGGGGRDRVSGGEGDDKLIGKRGRDKLRGAAGRDKIKARGGGRDTVNCGAGHDTAIISKNDRVRRCEKVRRKG